MHYAHKQPKQAQHYYEVGSKADSIKSANGLCKNVCCGGLFAFGRYEGWVAFVRYGGGVRKPTEFGSLVDVVFDPDVATERALQVCIVPRSLVGVRWGQILKVRRATNHEFQSESCGKNYFRGALDNALQRQRHNTYKTYKCEHKDSGESLQRDGHAHHGGCEHNEGDESNLRKTKSTYD